MSETHVPGRGLRIVANVLTILSLAAWMVSSVRFSLWILSGSCDVGVWSMYLSGFGFAVFCGFLALLLDLTTGSRRGLIAATTGMCLGLTPVVIMGSIYLFD